MAEDGDLPRRRDLGRRRIVREDPWLKDPGRIRRSDYRPGGRFGRKRRHHGSESGVPGTGGAVVSLLVPVEGGAYTSLKPLGERFVNFIAAAVEARSVDIVRRTAKAMDRALVNATPADTGRAVTNWLVTLDEPSDAVVPAAFPGKHGSTADRNRREAIEGAEEKIDDFDGSDGASICITNNLPYIKALNDGHSKQAPAGFVEEAIATARQTVADSRIFG